MPTKRKTLRNALRVLYFTKKERSGIAWLFVLCGAIWSSPIAMRLVFSPPPLVISSWNIPAATSPTAQTAELFQFNPNTATREEFVALGLSEKLAGTLIKYREKGGRFRQPEDFEKIYGLSPHDFQRLLPYLVFENGKAATAQHYTHVPAEPPRPFDPNSVSELQLQQWGVPTFIARRVVNFREKGGVFRKKTDLAHIYDFPPDVYKKLEAFILLPDTLEKKSAGIFPSKTREIKALEINAASVEEWQNLPGIGAGRAGYITRFREKLGGFISVNQVAETRGLPDSVFQAIKPYLHCQNTPLKTIAVNQAPLEVMSAHPYFTKKQAEMLIAYRTQHGRLASMEALSKAGPLFRDPAWQARIAPYISFE